MLHQVTFIFFKKHYIFFSSRGKREKRNKKPITFNLTSITLKTKQKDVIIKLEHFIYLISPSFIYIFSNTCRSSVPISQKWLP